MERPLTELMADATEKLIEEPRGALEKTTRFDEERSNYY